MILKGVLKFGFNNHLLFSIFDIVSSQAFLHYKEKSECDFSFIFLNSIAHLQHNTWCEEGSLDETCLYALQVIDKILETIIESLDIEEELVVMNALTQANIKNKKEDTLYRQINPTNFLNAINLEYKSVKQLMTNDAHILFETPEQASKARDIIIKGTLNNMKMFDVEYSDLTPNKLFFQLAIWSPLE
jgi:hypothetical protein